MAVSTEIVLEGKRLSFRLKGFTSEQNSHDHFMKHVARLQSIPQQEQHDPEQWHKVWAGEIPLVEKLSERKQQFRFLLKATIPRCPLASKAPTERKICVDCMNRPNEINAFRAVESGFQPYFSSYEEILASAVENALKNTDPNKGLYFITRDLTGFRLSALSPEQVFVVAVSRADQLGSFKVITGYRPTTGKHLMSFKEAAAEVREDRQIALNSNTLVSCTASERQ